MRKQLVSTWHGDKRLGRNTSQADLEPLQKLVKTADRTQVRRTEQNDLAHTISAEITHREIVTIQHVGSAVAQVVACRQPTHTVGNNIDLELLVVVVCTYLGDQLVESACSLDIILSPVVDQDVIASTTIGYRVTGYTLCIATRRFQGADDGTIEVTTRCPISNSIRFQL